MWETLNEIADRNGLNLHSERTLLIGDWNPQREHGKYEDGSFVISGMTTISGQVCIYDFYFERAGYLPCDDMTASCAYEYEEWEYTNTYGQSVSIAMRDVSTNKAWSQLDYLIFYSSDAATITIKASYGYPLNANATDDMLYAEQLADSIDFTALCLSNTPESALEILKGE